MRGLRDPVLDCFPRGITHPQDWIGHARTVPNCLRTWSPLAKALAKIEAHDAFVPVLELSEFLERMYVPARERSLDRMSDQAKKRAGAPSYTPPSEVAAECVDFLLTEEFHSLDPDAPQEAIVPKIEDGHVFVYLHPGDGAFSPHLPEPATVYEWIDGADGLDDSIPPGGWRIVIGNPDFKRRPDSVRYVLRGSQKRAELVALVLPSVFLRAFTDPDNPLLLEIVGHKDVSMEWGRDYLHLSFFVFRRQELIQGPPLPQLPRFKRYKSLDELASSHTPDDIAYQDREYELMKQYLEESRRWEEEEWKRQRRE